MAIVTCRECKKPVSSEAKLCPHCGARPRNPHTGLKVLIIFVGLFAIFSILEHKAHPPGEEGARDSRPVAPDLRAVERARYLADVGLDQPGARRAAAARLKEFCASHDRHLNYIEVKLRGTGLYCVHAFYSRLALSAGTLGPDMGQWVADNDELLRKSKITRVGVWGTGEYASGAWFDVK
jgi:hypothetical protein